MNVFHVHDDENGNFYRCSNTGCDVTKNRMKKYYLLRHKEETLLEKYEEAVKINDTIVKRRQSVSTGSFCLEEQCNSTGTNPDSTHTLLDKRLSNIIHSDLLSSPKERRFSVPTKSLVKYRKKAITAPRPFSCIDESIMEEFDLLSTKPLSKSSDALINLRLLSTPSSFTKIKSVSSDKIDQSTQRSSSETLTNKSSTIPFHQLKNSSTENLSKLHKSTDATPTPLSNDVKRKLSLSADNIYHTSIQSSLNKIKPKLTSSSDSINWKSTKHIQSHNIGNLYQVTKRLSLTVENIHSLTSESPLLLRRQRAFSQAKQYYQPLHNNQQYQQSEHQQKLETKQQLQHNHNHYIQQQRQQKYQYEIQQQQQKCHHQQQVQQQQQHYSQKKQPCLQYPNCHEKQTLQQQQQQQQYQQQDQPPMSKYEQRRIEARTKYGNRRKLLNSLNNDIKKANRFLRTLKTRSMPLFLENLQIDFEKPLDVSVLPKLKRPKIKAMRSFSVDMVI